MFVKQAMWAVVAPLACVAIGAGSGCETYDPPPEASLVQPTGGFWTDISPIEIVFTEPVDASTIHVSVWPSDYDIEGEFKPGLKPIIDDCTLASSPCALGLELELSDDRTKLSLIQNTAFRDFLGRPLVAIVGAGLKDDHGRERKVETSFDFQVNPRCGNEAVDLEMTTGVITMAADLQSPPITLYMYFDLGVDRATGKALLLGTFARLRQGDDVPKGPGNFNPLDFRADLSPTGWAVLLTGCVMNQPDGSVFLQSDPYDVNIMALGAIPVTLNDFMIQGTIRPRTDEQGRDAASGTLSTSGGSYTIEDEAIDVGPITTAWNGLGVFDAEIPDGLPRTCATDPCESLVARGGDCQLETPWEPGEACPASVGNSR